MAPRWRPGRVTVLEDEALVLAESWINGNQSWVVGQVLGKRSRLESSLLAVLVALNLERNAPGGGSDADRFAIGLESRVS